MSPTTKPATDAIDEILAVIKSAKSFCLSGHQNPDADVVGSQLAMLSLIQRFSKDKEVNIINHGPPPSSLSFLKGFERVENREQVGREYDCVIVFECSGADRMGNIIDFNTQAKTVINIDHHLHNPNFGHINLVEPTTSSTAELIYKIFSKSGFSLNQDEAMCIFSGLVADTGWFRYGNTNPQSLQIASKLLETGIQVEHLAERLYMSRTKAAMDLLGWVLSHMKMAYDNRVAILTLPENIYREFNCGPDDVEEIVNYGLKIDTVCASALLKERKDQNVVKVSLRSKGVWDINQVARVFGGGGHKNASGCSISGMLQDAEAKILKEISRIF